MNVVAIPYLAPLIVAAAITTILAFWVLRVDKTSKGVTFALILGLTSFWCLAYSAQLLSSTMESNIFWGNLKYVGIASVPVLFLIFGLYYANFEEKMTKTGIFSLFIVPLLTTVGIWTNDLHHLFRISQELVLQGEFITVISVDGPLFWFFSLYSYCCLFIGLSLIMWELSHMTHKAYRMQAIAILIGCLSPIVLNALYITEVITFSINYDPTPLTFVITGVCFMWAMFRYRFLDVVPFARQKVFESLVDPIFVFDANHRFVDYNKSAGSLINDGFLALKQQGTVVIGSLPSEVLKQSHEIFSKSYWKEDCNTEFVLKNKDEKRFFDAESIPIFDKSMHFIGETLVLRDVTQRKLDEQKNHEKNKKLLKFQDVLLNLSKIKFESFESTIKNITEETAKAIDVDISGVWLFSDDGKILESVDTFEDGSHCSGFQLETVNFPRYCTEVEMNRNIAAEDAWTDVRTNELLNVYLKKYHVMSMLDVPIRMYGKVVGMVCLEHKTKRSWLLEEQEFASSIADLVSIALEMREHKKAEDFIRKQNAELKKLDRLKSNFLNMTSHELRTPMTAMKGHTQMLLEEQLGSITEEQKKSLNVILRNTNRLDFLIKDILDTSRLDSGNMKFNAKSVDIYTLMEEVEETMAVSADLKHISLKFDVEATLPKIVLDAYRIKQVVENLITNAIKFSAEGSSIRIKVSRKDDDIYFEVRDEGIGITKDHVDHIFEAFYQVEGGVDRTFGGTGLGLTICRGIIQGHGGKIWAESDGIGKGSTFKFSLPVYSKLSTSEQNQAGSNIFEIETLDSSVEV